VNYIQINYVLPNFLSDADVLHSEIWHREVCFRKEEYYLISATSGAGKSSLLSYLFGERTDYTGEITYDNRKIASLKHSEWAKVRQSG